MVNPHLAALLAFAADTAKCRSLEKESPSPSPNPNPNKVCDAGLRSLSAVLRDSQVLEVLQLQACGLCLLFTSL